MSVRFDAAAIAAFSLFASAPTFADPSAAYLEPQLAPGDKFATVFSKAVSIKGSGFDEYVGRVSGSANDAVVTVSPGSYKIDETYRYDGRPEGELVIVVRDHGSTNCIAGKCAPNDETSGAHFIPYLWGDIPADIAVGASWTADIAAPWEIGPKGKERVTVVRLDSKNHLVTLKREGDGDGPSSDDAAAGGKGHIVVGGKTVSVTIAPGRTHWVGYTTIARGVTVSDEIMASRHVHLTAAGETYEGEERVYTLLIGAPG